MSRNFTTSFGHNARVETRRHLAAITIDGKFIKCVKAYRARTTLDCIRLLKQEVPYVLGTWHLA